MSDGKTALHSVLTAATAIAAGIGIYYLKVSLVADGTLDTAAAAAVTAVDAGAAPVSQTPDGKMSGDLEDPAARTTAPLPATAPLPLADSHTAPKPRKLRIARHLVPHPKPALEGEAPAQAPTAPNAPAHPGSSGTVALTPPRKESADAASPTLAPGPDGKTAPAATKAQDKDKEADKSDFKYALGAGQYRLPRWIGARTNETIAIPFFDINWRDQVELSSADGLVVDLLHGERWHGGLVGTMVWGRSRRDLQGLAGRLGTLKDTVQGGVYLEYALTPWFTLGGRWRHDIETTRGAYTDLYAELDLPDIGPIEHSLKLSGEAMNRKAMRRFFGVNEQEARALGIAGYAPGAGASRVFLNYDTFIPTSQHTGFAISVGTARLVGNAANSSVVRSFGKTRQNDAMVAFAIQF